MSKYTEGRLVITYTNVDEAIFLRRFGESWQEIARRLDVSVDGLSRSLLRRGYKELAREAIAATRWSPDQYARWGWWDA